MLERLLKTAAIILLCCSLLPRAATAQHMEGPGSRQLPDVVLLDQDGRSVRFYSDLVKGKAVAINFIYTSCVSFCSMQGERFARLQDLLGPKLGAEVTLISISIDPENDTPAKLKQWADRLNARDGWALLTGDKQEVDTLVKAITGDIARKGMHSLEVYIGHPDKGSWVRAYSLAEDSRLKKHIDDVLK
jgi:protein SCO1/2